MMRKESILKYVGKKVKLLLKNNNTYTVTIDNVNEDDFSSIDKFGKHLTISNDDVLVIESEEVRSE
jgi:hypothetical protein